MAKKMQVEIIRSNRKSIELQVGSDGHVRVRAPYQMTDAEIGDFLKEKNKWIENHLRMVQEEKERR